VSILDRVRAGSWWEHKLSPIVATMYATAAFARQPVASLWPAVVLAVVALGACASYVSLLNDLTDARDDHASGKRRTSGSTGIPPAYLIALCVAVGAAFLTTWHADRRLFFLYLSSWIAFTLYSVPPMRLKARGIWGVVADASGAHLFPTLFVVFLAWRWTGTPMSIAWTLAVAAWSFSAGIRGILRHQLEDADPDGRIGLRTFVVRRGARAAERLWLVAWGAELAAFAVMLWLSRGVVAAVLLGAYGVFTIARRRRLDQGVSVVAAGGNTRSAMLEYYVVLYPAAYLAAASWRQPAALILLVMHASLCARQALFMIHEAVLMNRPSAQRFVSANAGGLSRRA
jgi:4-hydroxybenzoate polyprenyltransferase